MDVDTLQTWIVVGVPALLTISALLVGRSRWRAWAAYVVLAVAAALFAIVPGDPVSAAVIGLLGFFFVATGRGETDDQYAEHHEHRERFTVADR